MSLFRLLYGFAVAMVCLAGTAGVLALTRLVLIQVRAVRRLTGQLDDPAERPVSPWEFTDCGQPLPDRHAAELEARRQ
jgi:hypothetical protein